MKILVMLHPQEGKEKADFLPFVQREAEYSWRLYQKGFTKESYFAKGRILPVLLVECPTEQEARHIMDTLPLVQVGLLHPELIPLEPYDQLHQRLVERNDPRPDWWPDDAPY